MQMQTTDFYALMPGGHRHPARVSMKKWMIDKLPLRSIFLLTHKFVCQALEKKPSFITVERDNQFIFISNQVELIIENKCLITDELKKTVKEIRVALNSRPNYDLPQNIRFKINFLLTMASILYNMAFVYLKYSSFSADKINKNFPRLTSFLDDSAYLIDLSIKIQVNEFDKKNIVAEANEWTTLFLSREWSDSWYTENTTNLAKTIYDNKQWGLCPILADALMDAGCEDEYLLWTLKEKHSLFCRGVWVIDKLLKKRD